MEDDKCYGIKKKMAIRRTILNKVLKVGLTEEVLFEQRLKGVGGVGHADKEQRVFQAVGTASGKAL